MSRLLRRVPDGALAAAVVLTVFALQLPFRLHWVNLTDEGGILQDATDILAGRRMYVDAIHPAFPGIFYLTAAAFAVGGATFDTARTLACVIFALTVGIAFRIGRWWLGPLGALGLVVAFVDYRVWAYPHWHMLSYSSLAIALLLGATLLVGAAFARGGIGTYVAAGMVASLAMVTKQDSGVLGTAGLALAILTVAPVPLRRRGVAMLYFGAGAMTVLASVVVVIGWAGMLPALIAHTIVAPLHGFRTFAYQGSPPLWPFFEQDAALRARPFSYFPSILIDLYLPKIIGSPLYQDTVLPDVAMRLVYHGLWLLPLVAVPFVARRVAPGDREAAVRRARERLVVLVALAFWLSFNRPHDWIHVLVLYPATLLVLAMCLGHARGRARTVVGGAVALVLAAVTLVSVRVALDVRRVLAAPVYSARGVAYSTPPQAASLQEMVDALAVAAPPDVPLASIPYHPLLNFFSGRPPLTSYYSIWPAEPDDGRTATVRRDLDARPDGLVVYNLSQAAFMPRMSEVAPELFAYLADNYRIAQALGGPPFGFEALLLRRKPPPFGRSLTADGLDRVRVVVDGAGEPPRDATSDERARLVASAVWPFQRVLRVGTVPGATVTVRIPVTPEPATRLLTSYGVNPDEWTRLPRFTPRFAIAIAAAGTETVVADAVLDPLRDRADRRWTDVAVDLGAWAGTPVELVLRVSSPPDVPAFTDRTGFGEPRVVP